MVAQSINFNCRVSLYSRLESDEFDRVDLLQKTPEELFLVSASSTE